MSCCERDFVPVICIWECFINEVNVNRCVFSASWLSVSLVSVVVVIYVTRLCHVTFGDRRGRDLFLLLFVSFLSFLTVCLYLRMLVRGSKLISYLFACLYYVVEGVGVVRINICYGSFVVITCFPIFWFLSIFSLVRPLKSVFSKSNRKVFAPEGAEVFVLSIFWVFGEILRIFDGAS